MDRLVNKTDIDLFNESILKKVMKEELKRDWKSLVKFEPLLFGDFIPTIYKNNDKTNRPLTGIYCELVERENLTKFSDQYLERYNEDMENKLNLVLF